MAKRRQDGDVLVFLCPATGQEVSSQIRTDSETLARVGNLPVIFACSACDGCHRFTAKSGWLGSPHASTVAVGCTGPINRKRYRSAKTIVGAARFMAIAGPESRG
jgi:hypothetical protein